MLDLFLKNKICHVCFYVSVLLLLVYHWNIHSLTHHAVVSIPIN